MITQTRYFGAVQYTELSVIRFPQGLPGFEELTEFLCIEEPALRPLVYLQSIADPQICFLTLPARVIDPAYEVQINDKEAQVLMLGSEPPLIGRNVACLAILSAGADRNSTANLVAPVLINISQRIGIQVIQVQSQYDFTHPVGCVQPQESAC